MSANDTSHVSGHLHVSPESKEPYAPEVLERLRADAARLRPGAGPARTLLP